MTDLREGARYRFLYRHTLAGYTERITATVRETRARCGSIRVTVHDGKHPARTHDCRNHFLDPSCIIRATRLPDIRPRLDMEE